MDQILRPFGPQNDRRPRGALVAPLVYVSCSYAFGLLEGAGLWLVTAIVAGHSVIGIVLWRVSRGPKKPVEPKVCSKAATCQRRAEMVTKGEVPPCVAPVTKLQPAVAKARPRPGKARTAS